MAAALVVGLGTAGGFALDALRRIPGIRLVAGIDPRGRRAAGGAAPPRVYLSLRELPAALRPDLVIVSTPTPMHVATCSEVLRLLPDTRLLLCEKPIACDFRQVESLLALAGRSRVRLEAMYHFAFSPEVLWGLARWPQLLDAHGPVVSFKACFCDPKPDPVAACEALVSNWVDAGINAMSVLSRFMMLGPPVTFRASGPLDCTATFGFPVQRGGAHGSIVTSWSPGPVVKTTRLRLADGASLSFDHVHGSATFVRPDGTSERRYAAHGRLRARDRYPAMLAAHLAGDPTVLRPEITRRIHALLSGGGRQSAIARRPVAARLGDHVPAVERSA